MISEPIQAMIDDILITEKNEATKHIEKEKGISDVSLQEASYNPFCLINFTLRKQSSNKLVWDTIEVHGNSKLTREEFSTSSYPWSIDSSNRIANVISELFRKRIEGEVLLTKVSFIYEKNIYFSIANVDPKELKARIVVFRSIDTTENEQGEYNFVDIRRRLDIFLHQEPSKFGFKQIILPQMSAIDVQLVIDKLEA